MKVFFDTETSGLPNFKLPSEDHSQPFLVEFAMLVDDDEGKRVGSLNCLVRPPSGKEIPREASAIHGITTERATKFGIPLGFVADYFACVIRSLGDGLLIAHNIKFDLKIMKIALLQSGVSRPEVEPLIKSVKSFCTMNTSCPIVNLPPTEKMIAAGFNRPKSPSLAECFRYLFGEELLGAHGALTDAEACRDVYYALTKEGAMQ